MIRKMIKLCSSPQIPIHDCASVEKRPLHYEEQEGFMQRDKSPNAESDVTVTDTLFGQPKSEKPTL